MAIEIPENIAHDIRQPILGDSFGWAGLEPAAAKKSIVIHGTGSEAPLEDGFTMADYHVNHNGWGGIGVHFVVTEDGYPGKPQFSLPAGAHAQYVGDLLTWRAGTLNQNNGRIHIEISGLLENHPPTAAQLRATRAIIDFLLAPNNLMPSLNFYSQVTYHNAVPGQNTACPGWRHPSFAQWFAYLQGGAFPDALFAPPAPAPDPTPVIPETPVIPDPPVPTPGTVIQPAPETPAPSDMTPGKGGGTDIPVNVVKEYQATYRVQAGQKAIQRDGAVAVSVPELTPIENSRARLGVGGIVDVAGYFDFQGRTYARTVYSELHDLWNGVDTVFFDLPTGQLSGPIAVNTPEVAHPAPDPIVLPDPTAVATNVSDQQLQEATVPAVPKPTVWQKWGEFIAAVIALFIKKRGSK